MNSKKGQTGPKTVKGKRISSMNALKSGIFAKTIVLPFEDEKAYKRHVKSIVESLEPENSLEKNVAEEIANSIWRGTRMQLNEAVQHDDIFSQLTPAYMAKLICSDREKNENAPPWLLDLKKTFTKNEVQENVKAYQQFLHLMQHSKGIQNYQMVWINYEKLFLYLEEWMKDLYEPALLLPNRRGLDLAWQRSPQKLEEALKKFSHQLWWSIHFNDLKPQIRNWMSSWYFLNAQHKHKITSLQEQLVKERRFCQGLIDSYTKLRKSRADHILFQSKFESGRIDNFVSTNSNANTDSTVNSDAESTSTKNEIEQNIDESIT
jgi:hypothetical protein